MNLCKGCKKSGSNHTDLPSDYWTSPNRNSGYVCRCIICQKSCKSHSEKLWEMHKIAVEKEQYWWLWPSEKREIFQTNSVHRHCVPEHNKKEKLYPITVGFARQGIARASTPNADSPVYTHSKSKWEFDEHNYWEFGEEFWHREDQLIPIYMSCTECDLYLGSTEEDNADILGGMCLKCSDHKAVNGVCIPLTGQEKVELSKTGSISSDEYQLLGKNNYKAKRRKFWDIQSRFCLKRMRKNTYMIK